MHWRIPKWLLVTSAALAAGFVVAWLGLLHLLNPPPRETAGELRFPPPGIDLQIAGQATGIQLVQGFHASSYDGWLGDGEAVDVYRVAEKDLATLMQTLKERTPGYVWSEYVYQETSFFGVGHLLPVAYRPIPNDRLQHGSTHDWSRPLYYVDLRRGLLYVVNLRI